MDTTPRTAQPTEPERPSPPGGLTPTLTSADYCSAAAWDRDRTRIFHAGWVYVCHVDGLPPGTRRSFDVAGESVIVARDRDGEVRAFANVCRHRGAQLCPATTEPHRGSIRCTYHAWTYGLDGALLATPRVDDDFDRGALGLWPYHAALHNGLVFVSVADEPPPLDDWIERHSPELRAYDHIPIAELKVAARTEVEVAANWKIVIENYNECLHCAVVHPELVELIPIYRTGHVVDPGRDDETVDLRPGAAALTLDGSTTASVLPNLESNPEYSGLVLYPSAMFDVTPTRLTVAALFPSGPDRTTVVTEYLFAADDLERAGFDADHEVALDELVAAQDHAVCEAVQRGVASRAFTTGVLTQKDSYVARFVAQYLDSCGVDRDE